MSDFSNMKLHITIGLDAALMALLSSASGVSIAAPAPSGKPTPPPPANAAPSPTADQSGTPSTPEAASPSENDGKTDAAGTVFDPARHTGTTVKSGLWRMKTGLSRPENEGENSPTYVKPGDTAAAGTKTPPPPPGAKTPPPPPTPAVDPNRPTDPAFIHDNGDGTELWYVGDAWDGGHPVPGAAAAPAEDDEFAAFAAAATAGATAQARSWTDADLSKLCNQAATKDGNPARVKPIIAKFTPAGAVEHSKNIPADQREAFAKEVEATIGITYEG